MQNCLKSVAFDTIVLVLCHFYTETVLTLVGVAIYVILWRTVFLRCHSEAPGDSRSYAFLAQKQGADAPRVRCFPNNCEGHCVFRPKTLVGNFEPDRRFWAGNALTHLNGARDIDGCGSFPGLRALRSIRGPRGGAFFLCGFVVRSGGGGRDIVVGLDGDIGGGGDIYLR